VGRHHAEAKTTDLLIAQFDCEADHTTEEVCYYLGIDRYPTVMYLGYGSFYSNDPISVYLFGQKPRLDRATVYEGELGDPQALSDWTDLMHMATMWHKWTNRLTSWFRPYKVSEPFLRYRHAHHLLSPLRMEEKKSLFSPKLIPRSNTLSYWSLCKGPSGLRELSGKAEGGKSAAEGGDEEDI